MDRAGRLNQRGVTPIISSLMLIVIAVASGAVAYVFIAGYMSQSAPASPTSAVSVDNVNGNATFVTLYVRNSGSSNVTVDCVYVYCGGTLLSAYDVNVMIPTGSMEAVVIPKGSMGTDRAYNFKVVCSGNTMTAVFNSYL